MLDDYRCGQCRHRWYRTGRCECKESPEWSQIRHEGDMACYRFDMDEDCDEYEEWLEDCDE